MRELMALNPVMKLATGRQAIFLKAEPRAARLGESPTASSRILAQASDGEKHHLEFHRRLADFSRHADTENHGHNDSCRARLRSPQPGPARCSRRDPSRLSAHMGRFVRCSAKGAVSDTVPAPITQPKVVSQSPSQATGSLSISERTLSAADVVNLRFRRAQLKAAGSVVVVLLGASGGACPDPASIGARRRREHEKSEPCL